MDVLDETLVPELQENQILYSKPNDFVVKYLSSLYLTLQCKYFLSYKSLQTIIKSLTDLNKINLLHIASILKNKYEVEDRAIEKIKKASFSKITHDPNCGPLRTVFSRNKYYKKNI